jgi:hypothetical protein
MNTQRFDEQVKELTIMSELLQGTIRTRIKSARNILVTEKVSREELDPRQEAELELRKLSGIIDGLMALHDKIYASLDLPPRYASFLRENPS